MTAQQEAVKKYVVQLSDEERERLNTLIRTGKHRARQLMKARILLKADVSEAGEGWSDSLIASALDTTVNTVARTRQRLVEEGFEAALTHKHSPASARPRIFDGVAEAKLFALACSEPPKGCARWTLKLLETAVVELNIVERASDNTIGRTLKKPSIPSFSPRHKRIDQPHGNSGRNRGAGVIGRSLRSRGGDSPHLDDRRVCLPTPIRELLWSSGSASRTRQFTTFSAAC